MLVSRDFCLMLVVHDELIGNGMDGKEGIG